MLHPKPPNVILPTPIATIAPSTTIHAGIFDGRLKPNSKPVITADQSVMVVRRVCITYLPIAHSVVTQASTLVAQTISEPMPKNMSEAANAGTRAIATSRMSCSIVRVAWMCGDCDMIRFDMFFICYFGVTFLCLCCFMALVVSLPLLCLSRLPCLSLCCRARDVLMGRCIGKSHILCTM